jgi:transposase
MFSLVTPPFSNVFNPVGQACTWQKALMPYPSPFLSPRGEGVTYLTIQGNKEIIVDKIGFYQGAYEWGKRLLKD